MERKERYKLTRKRNSDFVKDYKRSHGCEKCGYNKCVDALHFHHSEIKHKSIGYMASKNYSVETIKKEMDKCRLLCANCHIELHYSLGYPKRTGKKSKVVIPLIIKLNNRRIK